MDLKEIKRLVSLVEQANVSHLAVEQDGVKIEIKKELTGVPQQVVSIPQAQASVAPAAAPAQEAAPAESAATDSDLIEVKAQMVGTFYSSPNPDADAFVKVGDSISNGTVICIIEAMKLFNEIESEVSGTITDICVENGSPVEFGQTLFKVKP